MAKKAKKPPAVKQGSKGATKKVAGSRQARAKQSRSATNVKAKSAAKGLQFSAAQWKAYNAAYTAALRSGHAALTAQLTSQARLRALAQRRAAIAAAAQQIRSSRLTAAYRIQKKAAAAHSAASTAAIAANAVRQSYRQSQLAHQNLALEHRVEADLMRHLRTLGRLQFAAKGEKIYAHQAVMRTLTTPAATTLAQAQFANAVKTAKGAAATVRPKTRNQALRNQLASQNKAANAMINANAKAAGIAAARAVPAPRTAPRPRSVPRGTKGSWFGDPDGEDCVAAALLNSLAYALGSWPGDSRVPGLITRLCPAPTIPQALDCLAGALGELLGYSVLTEPELLGYSVLTEPELLALSTSGWHPGVVIGFETEAGPHAALTLPGGLIATWGETLPLDDVMLPGTVIEEAYVPLWRWPGDVGWPRAEDLRGEDRTGYPAVEPGVPAAAGAAEADGLG